jgi:tRNA pseudouridine38-40 synthase
VLLGADDVALTVAGRTDAGVHASGQVASYPSAPVRVSGLNALLPDDVAALSCTEAATEFDARRDATSRVYCYRVLARPGRGALLRGRALHWPHAVDFDALADCAAALSGTHDFTAFTPTETDHVRFSRDVYRAFWRRGAAPVGSRLRVAGSGPVGDQQLLGGELLEFWIEADAFMRHMNRVLVGTMLEVSSGRRSLESFRALLGGQPRSAAGPTAPAHGLYLAAVGYGGERVLGEASARWA